MAALSSLKSPRAPAQGAAGHLLRPAPARPVVLVVEDHEDTRFMLRVMLEMRGLEVVEATDGEEAVREAERLRPGLVLMDAGLPRLDGLSATRRIREAEGSRDIPVVILSGWAEASCRGRAFAAGCDAFIIKPFSVAQIDAVLESHGLSGRGSRAAGRE